MIARHPLTIRLLGPLECIPHVKADYRQGAKTVVGSAIPQEAGLVSRVRPASANPAVLG